MLISRTNGVPIEKGSINTSRLSLALEANGTDIPRDDSLARQCGPIGDPKDDEERGDALFVIVVSHRTAPEDWGKSKKLKNCTNLNLREDLKGDILDNTPASPRPNKQHKTKSVKDTRLNEHRDDRIVQSANSVQSPNGVSNILSVQGQSSDDHECEKDVK